MDDVDALRDVMVESAELARTGKYVGFGEPPETIEEEPAEKPSTPDEDFDSLISQIESSVVRPKTPFVGDSKSRDALLEQYKNYKNFVLDLKVSIGASEQVTLLRRKQLAQRKRKYDKMKAEVKELEDKIKSMSKQQAEQKRLLKINQQNI